jgi:release factor glutamine methyltransferase
MPPTEVWTIGRLLQWTTDYLKRHGAEGPRLDAEVLLAHALHCRRIELYTAFDQVPPDDVRSVFRELVRQRAEGTPVAYLVGHREFYSLSFRVTPAVLIPRPETEFVVIALLDLARQRPTASDLTICDVGTGSGILAVCAAKHLPNSQVAALDISPEALEVARQNVEAQGVLSQVELIQSDLFSDLPPERRFDFIVSNPPYVSESEFEGLAKEVREHEPRQALVAGPQGTEVIEALVPQAAERLQPGGHLLVEISPMIHDAVLELLRRDDRLEPAATIKDLAQLPRVVHAMRK